MGEHAASAAAGDCDSGSVAGNGGTATVKEWLAGLPSNEELMPLSQSLIPPRLAAAFSIKIEPPRTMLDVQRASQDFLASLRRQISSSSSSSPLKGFPSFAAVEGDESAAKDGSGESSRRTRHLDAAEESDSALRTENSNDESSGRAQKRPRLVWTPQLHKRFVDVVAHLGIKNAVPKTIMQLMNVEGLTRENVASHLQKYRLYLKRMQGISIEGPSSSEHLFVTSPVPPSLHEAPVASPMPYAPPPTLIQMPVIGMTHHGHGAPMAMGPLSGQLSGGAFRGFEAHHPYAMFGDRPKDSWPGGNNFAPTARFPHVSPGYR